MPKTTIAMADQYSFGIFGDGGFTPVPSVERMTELLQEAIAKQLDAPR